MKRLVAIVMSLTMILSCIPMMAFADAEEEKVGDKELVEVDEQIKKVNEFILEYASDQKVIDAYRTVTGYIDTYRPLVDAIVDAFEQGYLYPEDLQPYCEMLDDYIKELNKYVQEFKDQSKVQEALENALAKAKEMKAFLEENGVNFEDGLSEEDFEQIKALADDKLDEFMEQFEAKKAELEKALQELFDSITLEAIQDALDGVIEKAKEWAVEAGIDEATIDEFIQNLEDLRDLINDYVEDYKDMTPSEILDKVVEELTEILEDYKDELIDEALEIATQLLEDVDNGVYDDLFARMGLDPQIVKNIVNDLPMLALTYAFGGSVNDMFEQVFDLQWQVEDLKGLNKELKAQNTKLKNFLKKFINGYKVQKAKPKMLKAKNLKKRKVKVTFRGLKKLEATRYQIQAKAKKAKTKKALLKKKTKTAKKLTKTIKKFKKGKKYTVKVRAYYQFKYNGKTYKFWSKWSKGKKVKIKK